MIDCNIMVDVVNHLQKTEKFKNAEQEYQNLKSKSKKFDMSKASVVGGVLGFDLICLGSLLDNSAKGELFVAGGAVAIGSFYLVKKFREKLYGSKETINSMIRDCYLQEKAVKEKMSRGIDELSAREKTKAEFEAMPDYVRELKNNEFCKDVKKYEIDYSRQFDYRTFIVEEENVDESSNDLINCEILDTQAIDSEFEGENLESTEQNQETEPTM